MNIPTTSPRNHHINQKKMEQALKGDVYPDDISPRNLAQAGLNLFLTSFPNKATQAEPHLEKIPEEDTKTTRLDEESIQANLQKITRDQLIVIVGGPLKNNLSPGIWLQRRIDTGIHLYRQITQAIEERNVKAQCYLLPTGGDRARIGTNESDLIRRELIKRNIPAEQIMSGCLETSTVDNVLKLIPILRRTNLSDLHIITSEFHIQRVKLCFDAILGALPDLDIHLQYHAAPDDMSPSERAERDAAEQSLIVRLQSTLPKVIQSIRPYPSSQ